MADLTIIKGDTTSISVTFTDSDGAAIDITGTTIFFTVKNDTGKDDTYAVIQKNVTSHSDPTNGITAIPLSSTETNVKAGTYSWDLQIKYSNGDIQSITPGTCNIVQDITNRTS